MWASGRSTRLLSGASVSVAVPDSLGGVVFQEVQGEFEQAMPIKWLVSGALMLLYQRPVRRWAMPRPVEIGAGTAVGGGVGFLAGLLGTGRGVFVLPVLHGIGLDPKTATGTTALVALASSISGFASRATLGSLDVTFAVIAASAAAAGALVASRFATTRLSSGLDLLRDEHHG